MSVPSGTRTHRRHRTHRSNPERPDRSAVPGAVGPPRVGIESIPALATGGLRPAGTTPAGKPDDHRDSPTSVDRASRLAEAACLGADSVGELPGASHLLDEARRTSPAGWSKRLARPAGGAEPAPMPRRCARPTCQFCQPGWRCSPAAPVPWWPTTAGSRMRSMPRSPPAPRRFGTSVRGHSRWSPGSTWRPSVVRRPIPADAGAFRGGFPRTAVTPEDDPEVADRPSLLVIGTCCETPERLTPRSVMTM